MVIEWRAWYSNYSGHTVNVDEFEWKDDDGNMHVAHRGDVLILNRHWVADNKFIHDGILKPLPLKEVHDMNGRFVRLSSDEKGPSRKL